MRINFAHIFSYICSHWPFHTNLTITAATEQTTMTSPKAKEDDDKQQEEEQEQQSTPSFVECRGLRYALPYEAVSKPTFLKHVLDNANEPPLATALGRLYRRQRGTQDAEQAAAYWQAEIDAGRVEWRTAKKSREDPWNWHSVNNINANNDDNDNDDDNTQDRGTTTVVMAQPGMSVRFRQHVHEKVVPALTNARIPILYNDDHLVVIHKPAGLAVVDETGGRGVNALLTAVAAQLSQQQLVLTPAHRLDKAVSGVLLLGKSPSQAAKLLQTIQTDPKVRKRYIARCCRRQDDDASTATFSTPNDTAQTSFTTLSKQNDDFSTEPFVVTVDLKWQDWQRRSVPCTAAQSAQRSKDRTAHAKGQAARRAKKRARAMALRGGDGGNKNATEEVVTGDDKDDKDNVETTTKPTLHTTIFRRLGPPLPDGTILVECQPVTGYRHQIRAHLAALGWPVVHDAAYGGNGVVAINKDDVTQLRAYVDDDVGTLHRFLTAPAVWRPWCNKCQWTRRVLSSQQQQSSRDNNGNDDDDNNNNNKPIIVQEGGIWLHSHCYVLPSHNLHVVATLPDWAKDANAFL